IFSDLSSCIAPASNRERLSRNISSLSHADCCNCHQAEASFLAAIAADEKYVPPYLHLAAIDATHAKWPEVIRLSDKAIELDATSYPDPYYFKTVAHVMLKQIPEATR